MTTPDRYLRKLKECFPTPEVAIETVAAYNQACKLKHTLLPKWNALLENIQQAASIQVLRDVSFQEGHMFKCIISTRPRSSEAVILHLTMIGQFVGYVYVSDTARPADLRVSAADTSFFYEKLGYRPWTTVQNQIKAIVQPMVTRHFSDFEEFDSRYADVSVCDFASASVSFSRIDLFQALFTENMHGIL